jgi:mannose-6-phosphate isomerase-like protein (cupin superfamily)
MIKLTTCPRTEKPWGYEILFAKTDRYAGKILHIRAGEMLSRQYHKRKHETFVVLKGIMLLEVGNDDHRQTLTMNEGDVFDCPPGTIHRMRAMTNTDVFEVSTPELDDVVRLEDFYGRADVAPVSWWQRVKNFITK